MATGRDHSLWIRSAAENWQHLGNGQENCLDTPAISISGSTLTVACAGTDYGLWYSQATVSPGSLPQVGGWTDLGGYLTAGPAIATVAGQTTFAVTGKHQTVWFRTGVSDYIGSSWSCIGHPALANDGSQAYFACHGQDGSAWYSRNAGGGWSGAQSAGGRLLSGLSLVATSGGADMYVEGVDHEVYTSHIPANGLASGYTSTGGSVNQGGVGGVDAFFVHPPPTPQTQGTTLCGAPANPWGYNFCGGANVTAPPSNFCSFFSCIPSFWESTNGYVDECNDGMYSHSGGRSGACSYHDGEMRPLNA